MASANEGRTGGREESFIVGAGIRPEYLKLPRDLEALTRSFGIALSPDQHSDAATLTFSIECVDRLLDALPRASDREAFSNAVTGKLEGTQRDNHDLADELVIWLYRLERVMHARRVSVPFCHIVRQLLENSEAMRTTRSRSCFVRYACREGRLMVELLLLILGDSATPQFIAFMRRLSEPANLGDKLRDAHWDHARGELAIQPGVVFRLSLAYEIARRLLPLAVFCVGNWQLLTWGMNSLFTELILFRFSKSHAR